MTPILDSSFNPQLPDAGNHSISAGLGSLCKNNECGHVWLGFLTSQAFGLDLAYQALIYESRTVTGNLNTVAIPGASTAPITPSFTPAPSTFGSISNGDVNNDARD